MTTLTEFYLSLKDPIYNRNKYETASNALSLGYKIVTGYDVYKSPLSREAQIFVMENKEAILLPNKFNNQVVGYLLRAVYEKRFIAPKCIIPYGAGINNKPYLYPWIVVESCLDSDFLRNFYPFVISSYGVNVKVSTLDFLYGTAPYVIFGFDNDEAGNNAFKKMKYKYKDKAVQLSVPVGNKDFGDTLQHLQNQNFSQYDLECLFIKNSIQALIG